MPDTPIHSPRCDCRRACLGAFVLLAIAVVGSGWWLRTARNDATKLLVRSHWSAARAQLDWLLWLQPNDPQLRLMMAEAIARDDSLLAKSDTVRATEYLGGISDHAAEAVEARIREARLRFLLLHQPVAGERLLQRALKLNPDSIEAHSLLWPILDMTGRRDLVEPIFRRLRELRTSDAQVEILRDWFFSQIDPARFTTGLDERMGFRTSIDEPFRRSELKRLVAFRQQEPNEPTGHAALAQWFQQDGDIEQARRIVEEGRTISNTLNDSFFVSVLVSVLIESGELDQADRMFSVWPKPCDGHGYWNAAGQLQENLHRNYGAAAEMYSKAIAIWPGPADWKCQFRYAACLALNNEKENAEAIRTHAQDVQDLFKPDWQKRIHEAIVAPHQPQNLETILTFYRILGRDDEVKYWKRAVQR